VLSIGFVLRKEQKGEELEKEKVGRPQKGYFRNSTQDAIKYGRSDRTIVDTAI